MVLMQRYQSIHLGGDMYGRAVFVDISIGPCRIVRQLFPFAFDQRNRNRAPGFVDRGDGILVASEYLVKFRSFSAFDPTPVAK